MVIDIERLKADLSLMFSSKYRNEISHFILKSIPEVNTLEGNNVYDKLSRLFLDEENHKKYNTLLGTIYKLFIQILLKYKIGYDKGKDGYYAKTLRKVNTEELRNEIKIVIKQGFAPNKLLSDILSNISLLYRLEGGSGINFESIDIEVNETVEA